MKSDFYLEVVLSLVFNAKPRNKVRKILICEL